jgi:hypothetical protein
MKNEKVGIWPKISGMKKDNSKELLAANKELLDALNELHHFAVNNCKAYKSIHNDLHFRTVNIMANGLHKKFNKR